MALDSLYGRGKYLFHAPKDCPADETFQSKSNPSYASLQWFAIQTIFEQAKSDVLLLLDCCTAAGSAPADGHCTSVTETIAACGFETWAPQPGRHSFTNTLIAVLEEWQDRPGFTAAMLHCEVLNRLRHEKPERRGRTKNFECRRTPVHIFSTNDPKAGSVQLCSRRFVGLNQDFTGPTEPASMSPDNPSLNEPEGSGDALSDGAQSYGTASLTAVRDNGETVLPHVLISLALEEEQLLDVEQCRRWLQQFPILAVYAKVEAVYRSNSTLLILSVPVVIWDWMPNDCACAFIGYVHSKNMLAPNLGQEPYTVRSKRVRLASESEPFQSQISRQSSPASKPEPEISVLPPLQGQEPMGYWLPGAQLKHNHYRSSSQEQSQLLVGAGRPGLDNSSSQGTTVGRNMRRADNDSMKSGFSSESIVSQASTLGSNMSRATTVFDEPILESLQTMKFESPQFDGTNEYDADRKDSWGNGSLFRQKMEKSHSNENYTCSPATAARRSLQAHIELTAARPLVPKGENGEQLSSRNKVTGFVPQNEVAISKPTYVRPKHERIFCGLCDSFPDGFRGEHELRRHQDRQHQVSIKKWICVEPQDGQTNVKPVLPLSRCKACAVQKEYGAYYNAAAHLRRAHFRPKPKRNQSKSQTNLNNRFGGKAGGDWPSISDLEAWMTEIEVPAPLYPNAQSSDEDKDEEPEDFHSSVLDTSTNFGSDSLLEGSQMIELASQISPYSNDMAQFGAPVTHTPSAEASRTSSSWADNLQFTQNGQVPPALRVSELELGGWVKQNEVLTSSSFAHRQSQPQKSTLHWKSDLEQMPELDAIGEDPASYLLRTTSETV